MFMFYSGRGLALCAKCRHSSCSNVHQMWLNPSLKDTHMPGVSPYRVYIWPRWHWGRVWRWWWAPPPHSSSKAGCGGDTKRWWHWIEAGGHLFGPAPQQETQMCRVSPGSVKNKNKNCTPADSTVPTAAEKEKVGAKVSAALPILYLHKDFLQECPPVRRSQLLLGLNLTRGLLLDGCWGRWRWRGLRCGSYWCLSHVRQVEEQVETFDQRGWYGHGGHAVHSFLTIKEVTATRSSPLIHIAIFQICIHPVCRTECRMFGLWCKLGKLITFVRWFTTISQWVKNDNSFKGFVCEWAGKNECVPLKMIREIQYMGCVSSEGNESDNQRLPSTHTHTKWTPAG